MENLFSYIVLRLLVLSFKYDIFWTPVFAEGSSNKLHKVKQVTTDNGCPYLWDLGKNGYVYETPKICNSLLPMPKIINGTNETSGIQRQFTKSELIEIELVPEIEDGPSVYYTVTVDPLGKFERNITEIIIKVQKLNPNGKPGTPVGHFDIDTINFPGVKGYCCGNSKFYTLVHLMKEPGGKHLSVRMRWYPMNFKEGSIILKGHGVSEKSYWKIRSDTYKIPMILATTTESNEE